MFFKSDISLDDECSQFMLQDGVENTLSVFKQEISNVSDWTVENISTAINNTKINSGSKGKMLYMPIRIKTTGQMHGPELPDTLYLLGKNVVLERLCK